MQTARVTVLMTPEQKVRLRSRAARRGISTGELLRRSAEKTSDDDDITEAEFEFLCDELDKLIPQMRRDVEAMSESIAQARRAIDDALRATGART